MHLFGGIELRPFASGFFVNGVVVETRELTSQKNKSWSMTLAKVAEIGKNFEMEVPDESMIKGIENGDPVHCLCTVDFRNNGLKFVLIKLQKFDDFLNEYNSTVKSAKAS